MDNNFKLIDDLIKLMEDYKKSFGLNEINGLDTSNTINIPEYNDPCYRCPNNTKNNPFASGFCFCSLPSMGQITW